MTVRLVECGLAGGFIMAADHDLENDYLHARDYYEEDREIVFFRSCDDLIDRCRYYLAHPEQRREIAEAMRERSLRERTVVAAAESVLMQWRHLLNHNPPL